MKKLAIFLFALAAMLGVSAQEVADGARLVKRLCVDLASGQCEYYNLEDMPVVTLPDDRMEVKTNAVQAAYQRSEVTGFLITEDEIDALAPAAAADAYTFTYVGGIVTVCADSLGAVTLFGADGAEIVRAAASEGRAILNINNLPAGVYVVAPVGHKSVKIIK